MLLSVFTKKANSTTKPQTWVVADVDFTCANIDDSVIAGGMNPGICSHLEHAISVV